MAEGARPTRRHGWWTTFTWERTPIAAVAALIVVPVIAVVTKRLVEHYTSWVYEIHWLTTVPLLVVAFALVGNRLLNERAGRRRAAARGDPGTGGA